jgi:c-di-GMP-binding flagellar brake protein YcgR
MQQVSTSTPEVRTPARRSPRHKVNLAVCLFAEMQQRKCALQGRSHDLSAEGMAVYIPAELRRGQMVQVEFILPDSQLRLGVDGIVRDSEGFRCGLEFRNLSPADQLALTRYCEQLAGSR